MQTPPARGALSIPAADGYHYADDHDWDTQLQTELIKTLWDAVDELQKNSGDAAQPSA